MGSIVKRGNIYSIRYEAPQHPDGRRNQKKESCPGMNKRQAEDLLRQRETEVRSGSYIDTDNLTFSTWFQSWITRKANSLSPTTIEDYQQKFNTHVGPNLGHIVLQKLRPMTIQQLLDKLVNKLSAKTIRNIEGIIHSSLSDAVTLGITQSNPADRLILPKAQKPKTNLPQPMDLENLLNILDGSIYKLPFLIIMGTAMRRGEVLGLKWSDFDASTGRLVISRAIVQVKGQIIEKLPKSGKTRVVLLPPYLSQEIIRYQQEHKHESEWMIVDNAGKLLTPEALSKGYMRAASALEIKASLHEWRHAQATMLLMAGVPVKVVSERLGHANVGITQDLYAHVLPEMQQKAVDILQGVWEATVGKDRQKNKDTQELE